MARPMIAGRGHAQHGRRAAILVTLAFVATTLGVLAAPMATAAWSGGEFNAASEQRLIALTNQSRANAGLPALKPDPALAEIARWRSRDMVERDYFSHDIPPNGRSVFDEMQRRGYCFALAGENIGWNTYPDDAATDAIHQMFLDSAGHRKNIVGETWEVVGIGAYKAADGRKMWTVLFADRCEKTPAPTPKPREAATPRPTPRPTEAATPSPIPPPTLKPTATPTPAETATPTPAQTSSPTAEPTKTTSAQPTPTATPAPPPSATAAATPVPKRPTVPDRVPAPPAGGLRIADAPSPPGLFDSIVGGVASFFFGS